MKLLLRPYSPQGGRPGAAFLATLALVILVLIGWFSASQFWEALP